MRYGIFSDVHSNLEAFTAVIDAYKKERIDKYICLGDIVGYAANPRECIELTKELADVIIAGNHDWAVAGRFNTSYFNMNAKKSIFWTRDALDGQEKDFLGSLNLTFENQDFCLVHSELTKPYDFGYIFNLDIAKNNFNILSKKFLFVGHSHYPGVFIEKDEGIVFSKDSKIKLSSRHSYIINVGSVGQPRDFDSRACYCVFDSDEKQLQIKRIEYDIGLAQDKIIKANLPESLAARLYFGG